MEWNSSEVDTAKVSTFRVREMMTKSIQMSKGSNYISWMSYQNFLREIIFIHLISGSESSPRKFQQ